MLIPVLEMPLNEPEKPEKPKLEFSIGGQTFSSDQINIEYKLGTGTPAAQAAYQLSKGKGPYTMSGTLQLDAVDAKALQDALNNVAQKAPQPVISATSGGKHTECDCGHKQWKHDWAGQIESCRVDGCDCEEFRC